MLEQPIAPAQFRRFECTRHAFDPDTGELRLSWCWHSSDAVGTECSDAHSFEEIFQFPMAGSLSDARLRALPAAFDLLHWIAGVSYWKMLCQGEVSFAGREPDAWQSASLNEMYRSGLAELAWRNELHGKYWPDFEQADSTTTQPQSSAGSAGLSKRVLVALGGGKDSLVALERVREAGFEPITVQVGSAPLIAETAAAADTEHRIIHRTLSPNLQDFNRAGAINGHVPITAINSAALVIAALLWDCDTVVFANERSADVPTLVHKGQPINHQFAKSLAFEQQFGEWLQRYVARDLHVFSILRRDSELGVCREFADLTRYHATFSSCNRNFHLDGPRTSRWCGHCPKCLFVYLALAPFISPDQMQQIFGQDLLADQTLIEGFAELLELDGHRPFECVGEADEARTALAMLAESGYWRQHVVVHSLLQELADYGLDLSELNSDALLKPGGPHRIPPEFLV